MTPKLFIPFEDVRELTLYACYVAAVEKNLEIVTAEDLSNILGGLVSSNIIKRYFPSLEQNEKLLGHWNASYRKITTRLITFVEGEIQNKKSPFFDLHMRGLGWLQSRYAFAETESGERLVPASDRIVTISDNDLQAAEIVSRARELKRQIQSSNDLGTMSPQEQETAVSEIEQIETSFQPGLHRLISLFSISDQTLRWIADKAGGALVGAAAITLLGLILAYLGLAS